MMEVVKTVLAVLAAGLFLWGTGVCVFRTFQPAARVAQNPWPARDELRKAVLVSLAAGMLYQLIFLVFALRQSAGQPVMQALENFFYYNIDACHYVALAQYGYGTGEAFPEQYLMIVFFPLFPLLLRVLNPLGTVHWYLLGMLVQLPLFCCGAVGLYALARRYYDKANAAWALMFLLVSPAAHFFFTPMTESLFLALSVSYMLCMAKERWALCGLLGLLAALCRSPGALLAGTAAVWAIRFVRREKKRPSPGVLWAAAGPVAGLGIYFVINWVVYGKWNQFSVYQWEHWYQKMGLFFHTVQYLLDYAVNWWAGNRDSAVFISVTGLICIMVQLALLAAAARGLAPEHLAYGLAYTAFTTGATWLLSAPRYAVALFCLPMAVPLVLTKRWQRAAAAVLLLGCNMVYVWGFVNHAPIY